MTLRTAAAYWRPGGDKYNFFVFLGSKILNGSKTFLMYLRKVFRVCSRPACLVYTSTVVRCCHAGDRGPVGGQPGVKRWGSLLARQVERVITQTQYSRRSSRCSPQFCPRRAASVQSGRPRCEHSATTVTRPAVTRRARTESDSRGCSANSGPRTWDQNTRQDPD